MFISYNHKPEGSGIVEERIREGSRREKIRQIISYNHKPEGSGIVEERIREGSRREKIRQNETTGGPSSCLEKKPTINS